ncbi:MAG TPA: ribbon-helix-helix protein, CopG family [Tepidisphaeraceae bacterium]|jgi:hypothetical protein|nr:ribbon-helix-helix protein, CopG family [Tepidisphaeraceae bacterium]
MSKSKRLMTGEEFDALPDSEKERIWQEIDRMTPEELAASSRPLNKEEKAQWARAERKIARRKAVQKIRKLSIKLEDRLVDRVERLARREGVSRDQIIERSLKRTLRAL